MVLFTQDNRLNYYNMTLKTLASVIDQKFIITAINFVQPLSMIMECMKIISVEKKKRYLDLRDWKWKLA